MGFGQGRYAKIWKVENKGKYHVAEMSTSKKNRETDQYETDWQNKFVRLVGSAHEQIESMDISKSVKIGSCEVTNKYDKEKNITYTNYTIFGFEDPNGDSTAPKKQTETKTKDSFIGVSDTEDDELPFS